MKLSTKTRYAVRAVFDIAYHGQGKATQARDIARRQEVPLRYLEQIFQELKRAKLVEGKRGPNGGYSLGRPAERISIGDIVRAVQGPIELLFDDTEGGSDDGESTLVGGGDRDQTDHDEARSPSPNRMVSASVWRDLAQRVSDCFDEVTMRELCRRAEKLGIDRNGRNGRAERGGEAPRPMYFI